MVSNIYCFLFAFTVELHYFLISAFGSELPTLSSSPNSSTMVTTEIMQNTEKFGIIVQSVDRKKMFKSQKLPVKLKVCVPKYFNRQIYDSMMM